MDENLPPALATLLRDKGHDAYHVNEMKTHQKQRVSDDQLRRLALRKDCIPITRDNDFVKSFVQRKVPERMVFIYGLTFRDDVLHRMRELIPQLHTLLSDHDFIEINLTHVRFPFSDPR